MPAVDYRLPGGIGCDEAATLLRRASALPTFRGLTVSIYNPSLDADGVATAFAATRSADSAREDFARAADLDVHSYPTLLAIDGDRQTTIAVGHASVGEIDRHLHAFALAS